MQTSESENWSSIDVLLGRSCHVLRNVFRQRWLCCTGSIWNDTPQSSEAFLRGPFGKNFRAQNDVQKQYMAEGNINEWDIPMLAAILITWTIPTSSSMYRFIVIENQFVENIERVRNFFVQLPTNQIDEATFRQKQFILISSLRDLGDDPVQLKHLSFNSARDRISTSRNSPLITENKSTTSGPPKETSGDCCSCGFGIKKALAKMEKGYSFRHYCPNTNKLDNHVDSPPFRMLCDENDPDAPYYKWYDSCVTLKRHWCLMGEIREVIRLMRTSLFIRTRFDEDVPVHFYLKEDQQPKTFSFADAVVGNTLVIMYPDQHAFLDMTTGIRQEDPDTVTIFRCSMRQLIKTFASVVSSSQCFQCHATSPTSQSLQRCSKCRVALYCNKDCQTHHWKDNHKQLCSSMKYLEQLHQLDFTRIKCTPNGDWKAFSFTEFVS